MMQATKTSLIEKEILKLLDAGMIDLQDIYTIICDRFGVERATVRRIRRQLVDELKRKVKVLDSLASKKPVRKPPASDPNKLTPLEERVLELLESKKEPIKFKFIYDILNFDTHYSKITKKQLSYYLAKMCVARLIKNKGESRYKILGEGSKLV